MIPNGIDDKYEVIRILQETAASAVLLVRHKTIGELRILKAIQKSHPEASSILSEANLLTGFKSSGIPTIYDVVETTEFNYLVEEYVDGLSLQEFLLQENDISLDFIISISIKICEIVELLHTAGEEPILYRDMKPEHVIMQGESIKLIDFGIATKKSESKRAIRKGTKSYAAPEQLLGETLDERTDVYGIGAVINECLKHTKSRDTLKIRSIVKKALESDKTKRINSVNELRLLLLSLQGRPKYEKFGGEHLNKKFAVVGNTKSVGTTHISIKLTQYLRKIGCEAFYEDVAEKKNMNNILNSIRKPILKEGVLYHRNFAGIMSYGPAVEKFKPPKGIIVEDYGFSEEEIFADRIFYVVNGSPWLLKQFYPKWIEDERVIIIANFADRLYAASLAKKLGKKVYCYPLSRDIFNLTKEECKFFKKTSGEKGFEKFER